MLVQELSLRMDRNGDGHLSYNELRAMLESDAFDCGYEDVEEAGSTGCSRTYLEPEKVFRLEDMYEVLGYIIDIYIYQCLQTMHTLRIISWCALGLGVSWFALRGPWQYGWESGWLRGFWRNEASHHGGAALGTPCWVFFIVRVSEHISFTDAD